jgi:hypothetical protein
MEPSELSGQIQQYYEILEDLKVPLDKSPQRGLAYLRERMIECREKQDRVTDLLAEVRKPYAAIRTQVRNLKASVELAKNTPEIAPLRTALYEWADLDDEVRYLTDVIKAKASNLKMTSSDIRLLYSVVEQQLKLGEVQPGRHTDNRSASVKPVEMPPPESPQIPSKEETVEDTVPAVAAPPVVVPAGEDVLSIENFFADKPR